MCAGLHSLMQVGPRSHESWDEPTGRCAPLGATASDQGRSGQERSSRRAVGPPGRSRQPGVGWHATGTVLRAAGNAAPTTRGLRAAREQHRVTPVATRCFRPLAASVLISISSRCSRARGFSPTPARGKAALSSASIWVSGPPDKSFYCRRA
jgi:hypothetical protein